MTFTEMINTVESTSDEFSTFSSKCESFVEAVSLELERNYKEIELKVIEEAGTDSDKDKLNGAATEGALAKMTKAIKALIEKFKEMMAKIFKAISEFFTSKSTEDTLKKADDAIKSNPKIKNEKFEVPNTDGIIKAYEEGTNKLEKKLAEMKAGKSVSDKDIDKIIDETDEKVKKAKAIKVGAVAVGIVTAATGIYTYVKNNNSKDVKAVEDASVEYETTDTPEKVATKFKAINAMSNLTNKKYMEAEAGLRSFITKLQGMFTHMKPTELPNVDGEKKPSKKDKEDIEESVAMSEEEKTEMLSKIMEEVEESVHTEIPEDLSEEEQKEVDEFNKSHKVTESTDIVTPEDYLAVIEASIDEADTEEETVEESAYVSELEAELFTEEDDSINETEAYLNALESTIDNAESSEEDVTEESVDEDSVEAYINALEAAMSETETSGEEEVTEGAAKDAKKVFFLKTEKQFDRVKEIIKKLKEKDSDLTYEEKMNLADEALDIINVLLSEVEAIPEDDFLDNVTSIKTYLNGLKAIFNFVFKYLLVKALSGGDVAVFSFKRYIDPHKQKDEAVNAIRKLQKEINKQIIAAEKEARKAEQEKLKAAKEAEKTAKEVKESTADEIVDSLLAELN